tara:strand:- start:174098 stop:175282 length:1185 start_codon:yes stop_codon:yes gene_type:complete
MNRRLIFIVFLLACVAGLWNLRDRLTPEAPQVTPYAARPELLDNNGPALVNTVNNGDIVNAVINEVPDRLTAQQRMEAAFVPEQTEALPDFSCTMAPVREVVEARTNRIYQWRDENGLLHFSDSPPAGVATDEFDARQPTALEYFQLNIDFRGANGVPFFRNQLEAQANSMYRILTDMLGSERLKQVDLNVIIFPDRGSYQQYAVATGGESLVNSGGFYTNASNEAVTYIYENDEETLAVTRHEAAHVMLNGMLATGPLWLHEGMAEYFEQLSMRQQYTQIAPNADWLQIARTSINNGYPGSLSDYLDAAPEDWRGSRQTVHYALAWSLVYFLLDSNQGRQSLSALLQRTADDYCTPTNSVVQLNLNYPGGIPALQENFYSWLNSDDSKRTHIY